MFTVLLQHPTQFFLLCLCCAVPLMNKSNQPVSNFRRVLKGYYIITSSECVTIHKPHFLFWTLPEKNTLMKDHERF